MSNLEDSDFKFNSPTELQTLSRVEVVDPSRTSVVEYRLYKRRWVGLLANCLLTIVSTAGLGWFSPIAIPTSEAFGISIHRVNWMSNVNNVVFLPVSLVIPIVCSRYGLRIPCLVGTVSMLISAWVRYAGTSPSLSPDGKFALIMLAQIFVSMAQPWFLVLGPKYSEVWFDLKGRTTATMFVALSNPIGSAIGQVVAPFCSTVRGSVLVLAIVTTVVAPAALLIQPAPPVPPTFAGSHPSPPPIQILRAFLGRPRPGEATMKLRERFDSVILILCFGSLVGAFTALSMLLSQVIAPYGYDSGDAGIMGGVTILAGVIGGMVASPVFDRYLTHHLALAAKLIIPILGAGYIGLIWAVRENNTAALYVILVVLGIGSFTLLPVALEMGCEVTRSAEVSSAVLWCVGNLLTVVFVTSMDALRDDSPTANPPSNMRKSLIFEAILVAVCASSIIGLKGEQTRREIDEQKQQEAVHPQQNAEP